MPYAIRKHGSEYAVVNEATGKVHGKHPSKKHAVRQVRALYAATGGKVLCDGGAVKALDDAGRVGGYLVLFGDPDATDASEHRDYFTPETDFGLDLTAKSRLIYHHGLDPHLGTRTLAIVELKVQDAGVWMEGQLALRDDYERKLHDKGIKAGRMGLSSGTAAHLVRRAKQPNGAHKVLAWPLGLDASITPTPAEPRTAAYSLKSLIGPESDPAPVIHRPKPFAIARFLMHGHALRGLGPGGQ